MLAPTAALLTTPSSIRIDDVVLDGDAVVLLVTPTKSTPVCPECGQRSSRVHSRYSRTVADLPWQARAVRLQLRVRRFFCTTKACRKKTFSERIPELVASHARVTCRLEHAHRLIGHALGGEAGARLAIPLGMPISPDTLLRRVKSSPRSRPTSIRVLGVDDWAWKKGQRYGTILCDLERRRPVDLLPERSADSLASWLKAHPGVEIISRDRGDEYIKGANQGAPEAVQVADRWHLLLNLREALMRAVDRHHGHVLEAAKAVAARQELEPLSAKTPKREAAEKRLPPDHRTERSQQRRARRLERYRRVVELNEQGVSLRGIARSMGMHRATVRHWLGAGSFPELARRRVTSRTDAFLDDLKASLGRRLPQRGPVDPRDPGTGLLGLLRDGPAARVAVASGGANPGLPPRESAECTFAEASLVEAGLLVVARGAGRTQTRGTRVRASPGRSLRGIEDLSRAGPCVRRHGAPPPRRGLGELDDERPRAGRGP